MRLRECVWIRISKKELSSLGSPIYLTFIQHLPCDRCCDAGGDSLIHENVQSRKGDTKYTCVAHAKYKSDKLL